jgi:hypothetical protein
MEPNCGARRTKRQTVAARIRKALVASVACAFCSLGALTDGASAATTQTLSWGDRSAMGSFSSLVGCDLLSGQVWAFDAFERQGQSGTTNGTVVYVDLSRTNICEGTGTSSFGPAQLQRGDFKVRGDLGAASLNATVMLMPMGSDQAVPLDLDLTWYATNDRVKSRDNFVAHNPDGSLAISHTLSAYHSAVATGIISDGAVDYTGGTESNAGSIGTGRNGFVTASK